MFIVLWLFFILLNGRLDLETALLGIPVAAASMLFACLLLGWDIKREFKRVLLLPRAFIFAFILIWEIFKANVDVFKRVYSPKEPVPAIVKVRRKFPPEWQTALLANCITLTPGTITMRLSDDDLTVHCLDESLAEGLEDSVFEKNIEKMGEQVK